MNWILFLQIEVVLLTVGLVCSFVVSMYFTQKDNSWAKRATAFGEAFKTLSKEISANRSDANAKVLNELIDAIKESKKERKDN